VSDRQLGPACDSFHEAPLKSRYRNVTFRPLFGYPEVWLLTPCGAMGI